jgi:hypothetical protein
MAGVVRQLIYDHLEDEEHIRDGLKTLQEKGDTMDWALRRNTLYARDDKAHLATVLKVAIRREDTYQGLW